MATYYFRNVDVNWGDAANWSLSSGGPADGAVPTNLDDVIFDNNSGNCTVDSVGRVCKTINFTNYINTITMSNIITISGNVTLGSGMGISGTMGLIINTTSTLTSNGKFWPNNLSPLTSGAIYTFADDWIIGGSFNGDGGGTPTYIGSTVTVGGNLTFRATGAGTTTNWVMNGTGVFSASANLAGSSNLTINTTGTVSIVGTILYGWTGTFSYIPGAGTLITTGSTINKDNNNPGGDVGTFSLPGVTLNNLGLNYNGILTLASDINVAGNLSLSALGYSTVLSGGTTITCGGNLTVNGTSSITSGNVKIVLNGFGTWSHNTTGQLRNDLTINTSSTITITGNVYYSTGILTYSGGTVITTGSTLNIRGSTTLNTSGITWNSIFTPSVTSTLTLISELRSTGTVFFPNALITTTISGETLSVGGNLTHLNANNVIGTSTILFNGTGNWATNGSSPIIRNPIVIDTTGSLNITGTINFKTLTYVSGNVTAIQADLNVVETDAVLYTENILFGSLQNSGLNLTLNSDLYCNRLFLGIGGNPILNGNNIYCYGSLGGTNNTITSGTTNIFLLGSGTLSGGALTNTRITNNITINTPYKYTLSGTFRYSNGTFSIIRGYVDSEPTANFIINIAGSTTNLINPNRIFARLITITGNSFINTNNFFSGTPNLKTTLRSTSLANYTINFTDGFEKLASFTKISNCTISRPGQLLCLTDNSNKGNNLGIRYINNLPNGVIQENSFIDGYVPINPTTYVADPSCVRF